MNLVDFYPTSSKTIAKLVDGIPFTHSISILEPSAGTGNICDYIKEQYYSYRDIDLDVIEINTDFQHILKGKEYRLIHDDFLTFQTRKHYDFIIANFPFSEGDKHLAKTLQLLEQNGGELRCLVNAETIKNPYSNLRKELVRKLDDLGAQIEYLSDEFLQAERKTAVEVALIKVKAEVPQPVSVILETMKKAQFADTEETAQQGLVENDFIKTITARFNIECDLGIRFINEYYAMQPFIQKRLLKPSDSNSPAPLLELKVIDKRPNNGLAGTINSFLQGVRHKYWQALLDDSRFNSQYTSNILTDLHQKLKDLQDYDFTSFNIESLQKELAAKVLKGVEAAIIQLFDTFSREYAYGKDFGNNIHYYNGWKTNKAHKVNKKIIIPMYGLEKKWSGGSKLHYGMEEKLTDMVKVFNYLSADKADVPKLVGSCVYNANQIQDFQLDLRYFSLKLYKKGTCHITFLNQELLDKFNIFGGQRKKRMSPSYEEQAVIDDFKGKEAYQTVLNKAEF